MANGLENFWSLFKRSVRGTYVSVEPFHLFRYLDEQAFRFNERSWKDADRFHKTVSQIVGKRIMFKDLPPLGTTQVRHTQTVWRPAAWLEP